MSRKRSVLVAAALLSLSASAGTAQDYFYGTGDGGTAIWRTDLATGASTRIGSAGYGATWAGAYNPAGQFYTLIQSNRLGEVNLSTGAATPVGPHTSPQTPVYGLETSATGQMYAAAIPGGFYGVDQSTGQFTFVGNMGISGLMDLAFDPVGTLYGLAMNRLYTIDVNTGLATLYRQILGTTAEAMGMAFSSSGDLYVTSHESNSGLYQVDLATGAASLIGRTGIGHAHGGDIYLEQSTVPEPMTLTLLGTGLAGVAVLRRRRRQAASA